MVWLAKISMQSARFFTTLSSTSSASQEFRLEETFIFDVFVLFDTDDASVGEWVDNHLVPQLNESTLGIKVAMMGRDDQCGEAPIIQHLRKIRVSRKVIIVLTENYWHSSKCKYMLSVIENLHYQTGHDRAVVITFGDETNLENLLKSQRRFTPWYVLQFLHGGRESSMFWDSLHYTLL